jgi:DNA-binding NtrC family response regulator
MYAKLDQGRAMAEDITGDTAVVRRLSEAVERYVVVFRDAGFGASIVLPEEGVVSIGRSARHAVRIDHETVSRKHAVLRIGAVITIEDLGSTNGTWVGDERLLDHVPHELPLDEVALVGSVRFAIQRRAAGDTPTLPPQPARLRRGDPAERQSIIDALARANGHQATAAKLLGISRRTLINRLEQYQLPRPRKRSPG